MVARQIPFTGIAPASGVVTIQISSGAMEWNITQISTECSAAPVAARCVIRKNGAIVSKMLPAGDVASGEPSIPLLPGEVMTVGWTGVTVGAACKATVFVDDGR